MWRIVVLAICLGGCSSPKYSQAHRFCAYLVFPDARCSVETGALGGYVISCPMEADAFEIGRYARQTGMMLQ